MIGIGIGIGFMAGAGIDAQAQAHYNRVIADGGVVPAGVSGTNAFFNAVKTIYATSDITTAVSVGLDAQYLGYKLGAGSGTTLGQAAQKLYSCAGSSGDVVQTTAASQPLLLDHSGASSDNYWFSPQIIGNFCTAPNITIPTASGFEMDVKVSFTTNDDFINTSGWFVSHDSGGSPNRNIFLGFSGSRTLTLYLNNLLLQATATTQIPVAFSGWLRVNATTVSTNMEVKYYTSTDGVTFTQLGSTITLIGGANCIKTTAIKLDITGNNGANTTSGKCFRAIFKDANGVTRSDFNPATYTASTSQTQWTSATGEVWTINTGTASTGYKGVLVDRTIVQSDGVDDNLSATIAITGVKSGYWAIKRLADATKSVTDALVANKFNLYTDATTSLSIYTNTGNLASSGLTRNILSQFAVVNNGASSTISKNDGVKTTGTLNNNTLTGIKLFNGADGFSNFHINTHIITSIADSNAQQTAMYNYIRSLNNNAF